MSTDSTGTEVFEDVEPDPDAVLAEFDVESPDDLVEVGGAHDTIPDDELDVDDTTAAELFAGLADAEPADTHSDDQVGETGYPGEDDRPVPDDLEFEFVGDSDVTIRNDGDAIESTAAELGELVAAESPSDERAGSDDDTGPADCTDVERTADTDDSTGTLTVRSGSADELELVGPDPTPTRVTNDAFSGVEADAR